MNNKSREFLSLLSYLYLQNGKATKAVTVLEALLVLQPDDVWASRSLAYAYVLAGEHDNCLAQLDALPRSQRSDTRMQLIRSRALWGLGRKDEAHRVIKQLSGNLRGTNGRGA